MLLAALIMVAILSPKVGNKKNPPVKEPATAPSVLIEYSKPTRLPTLLKLVLMNLDSNGRVAPMQVVGGNKIIAATRKRSNANGR
jgi:hypothetical protein